MSRKKSAAGTAPSERDVLFGQLKHIAQGLGETFAPFCEVVLHDLTTPKNAIVAIHNNLSGRKVGQPATELGLARIADPDYTPGEGEPTTPLLRGVGLPADVLEQVYHHNARRLLNR